MTAILQLILGVPSTAYLGDPSPTEPEPQIIDLLDANAVIQSESVGGFRQYDRAVTDLKNGGITADSQAVDGTEYLAQPVGDVSETIPCIASGADPVARAAAISKLMEFVRAVRQFHSTTSYPFVPYIKVQELGDAGPRYALIKTISVNVSGASFDQQTQDVVISYTREPYWRGLAPGEPPIKWSLENYYDLKPTTEDPPPSGFYSYGDLIMYDHAQKHLWTTDVDQTQDVCNFTDIAATGATEKLRSFIKIPGERIPGDAPALVSISVEMLPASGHYLLRIGKQTAQFPDLYSVVNFDDRQSPVTALAWSPFNNTVDAIIATNLSSSTISTTVNNGIPYNGTYYYQQIAYNAAPSGTDRVLMQWTGSSTRNHPRYGKYAVFLRGKYDTGTETDVTLKLRFENQGYPVSDIPIESSEFNIPRPIVTTEPGIVFCGVFDIPPYAQHVYSQSASGLGVNDRTDYDFTIQLLGTNTGTATLTFSVYDVFMMPLEQYIELQALSTEDLSGGGTGGVDVLNYDNTGYYSRGRGESYFFNSSGNPNIYPVEMRGQGFTLEPRKDAYFYFNLQQWTNLAGTGTPIYNTIQQGAANNRIRVWVNIVPRWHNQRTE